MSCPRNYDDESCRDAGYCKNGTIFVPFILDGIFSFNMSITISCKNIPIGKLLVISSVLICFILGSILL